MEQVYNRLYAVYMQQYIGHFGDEYKGQNKLRRMATLFAVANTKRVWIEEQQRLGGF